MTPTLVRAGLRGLEFISRRWMRLGGTVERQVPLDLIAANWCFLLAE
ncbi:MAG TPA: hypothetical protein VLT34_18225 [Arthrobacter sp.]|nr:hypothetical protein [Arthrobacter sp.]